ncbi:DUF6786 family protein [Acidobacterium sp. S8]|uniref:DUF6786 family protein n=1 Tax=Acidobacterium sp. S8 TaxID=1641854 RepID=UPI00131AB29E|nr:DUF6786 family protein [Acidobacterium sp. S8]
MITHLIDTLTGIDKAPTMWTSSDGSRILALPYGGRILGLFTSASDKNFFWTHPALEAVDSARAFYQSSSWHNSGGDRTWLSPEVDFFIPNFPSFDTYFQPREFDPGTYELTTENRELALTNTFTSRLSRSKDTARMRITKRISAALDPLREVDAGTFSQLEYAGFTLQTRLEIFESTGPVELNLWSLLQLPHGGDLIIPTFSRASVVHFMGTIADEDLEVTDQYIRYKMRAEGENKIGVSSLCLAGRVGYLRTDGRNASLVIRNIAVNPSAKYLDMPWNSPMPAGAAVQACNIDSNLGAFSELEYHAPAIGGTSGLSSCDDVSQLWAFTGPRDAVASAARLLLCSAL